MNVQWIVRAPQGRWIGTASFLLCLYLVFGGNRLYDPRYPAPPPFSRLEVAGIYGMAAICICLPYAVHFYKKSRVEGDERMWMYCAAACALFVLIAANQLYLGLTALGWLH